MPTEPKDCASPEVRLLTEPENPRVTAAIGWARKVAASKPPRYTDASRNAAAYILEREAAEAASKAREAALVEALGRAELGSWSLQQCDITFTFADANDLRIVRDTASAARAALTKEPDT